MHPDHQLNRRRFLKVSSGLAVYSLTISPARAFASATPPIDHYFEELLRDRHVPGIALAIAGQNRNSLGPGGTDSPTVKSGTQMSPVRTILNIGSVSKTIAATAVLQLCEQGKLSLTEDVNTILPFSLRNPFHPEIPITTWQLLVHRSSIKDGPQYGRS